MRKLIILSICSIFLLSFLTLANAEWPSKHNKPDKDLTRINPRFMVTPEEAWHWHYFKDKGGPTYSGSPSWKRYIEFLEAKFEEYGVRDVTHNSFSYTRWYTTEWPHDSNWTLISDGAPVKVASYGAYSGATSDAGITAELIYYDYNSPPPLSSLAGKIVVLPTKPIPNPLTTSYLQSYTLPDYEYRTDTNTFPPMFTVVPPSVTVSFDTWYQLSSISGQVNSIIKPGNAAGAVIVWDACYDRVAGMYTFGVPAPYNAPTLFLDRVAGSKVIADAKNHKTATLKLLANTELVEPYQLIGFLPGKNYGTAKDEIVVLTTHTDGPSISQEDGALGILGIVHYFSHIPQSERPRTLMVFMTSNHFMPSGVFDPTWDWFKRHPEASKQVVGEMCTEHLGQQAWREVGEVFERTGLPEGSYLYCRNNEILIDKAIEAAIDNHWPRVQVEAPETPGIHGGSQGPWYGEGSAAAMARRGYPDAAGYSMQGFLGGYWQTTARIDRFDKYLYYKQIATMTQLTGELMVADIIKVSPYWGNLETAIAALPDSAFIAPGSASDQRNALLRDSDSVFNLVKAGAYGKATKKLQNLENEITLSIVAASQAPLITLIDKAIALLAS